MKGLVSTPDMKRLSNIEIERFIIVELKEEQKVKRGEIYLYDFGDNEGSIQNGIRPVLVVQCDGGNQASTTTVVAALTTVIKRQFLPSHIVLGEKFGLKEPSMVMLEQLKTVNQSDLTKYIGIVNSPYLLRKIRKGLMTALDLWVSDKQPQGKLDVRCLCSKCLDDYKSNPDYIVRRLDPFERQKQKCDKCQNLGYEYIVSRKRQVNRTQ